MNKNTSFEARAMAAYFASAAKQIETYGGSVIQPGSAEIEDHDGMRYVVLRNIGGVLAVYRITTQDTLKAMKRWPKTLA
jgi:hypothetical protein